MFPNNDADGVSDSHQHRQQCGYWQKGCTWASLTELTRPALSGPATWSSTSSDSVITGTPVTKGAPGTSAILLAT